MASKTLEAPLPPLPIASNKLVVPFLPLPEGLFPNQTLPAEEDAELPRLIDTGLLLERLKSGPEVELGDICVPDMIFTVLYNYDKNFLKTFLDPKHEKIGFCRWENDPENHYFYIGKVGLYITERRI